MTRRSLLRSGLAGLLLLWTTIAAAALPSTAVFEVHTTGSATAGGFFNAARGGTDYSQSDTLIASATDAVANGTTTVTSATAAFTDPMKGNGACIAGAWYEVVSVTNATTIVVDRTIAAASGLTLKLGGALDHPATAGGAYVGGNTLWVRSGTYPCGPTSNASGGRLTISVTGTDAAPNRVYGYGATRGDGGTMPILRASAASVTILTASGSNTYVEGLEFQANGNASVKGLVLSNSFGLVTRCRFTGLTGNACEVSGTAATIRDCEAVSCSNFAFFGTGANGLSFRGCTARNNTVAAPFSVGTCQGASVVGCVATATASGVAGFSSAVNSRNTRFSGCVAHAGGSGFDVSGPAILEDCLAVGNSTYGFGGSTPGNAASILLRRCAGYANPSGNLDGNQAATSFIALTADPFTNAAGLDFSLNNTPGGGALLRSIPRTLPGLAGTSYLDLGAYQHRQPGRAN